ncbi:MAG: type ISP restriction/modification enzyme [Limisphaerales bacterium]
MATSEFVIYVAALSQNLKHGDATEHTHRPALKALLESIGKDIVATNEPTRILCGAPDFNITRDNVPLGHVETKDIGENLDLMERGKAPHGEQFGRYRDGLLNWILTDYLEFRWYVNGERRLTARLAELDGKGKVKAVPGGEGAVAELLGAFLTQKALTIGTAKELAQRMAGMTRIIRDLIIKTFEHEVEKGLLHNWLAAFRETLIPDLDEKQFADMFAQTLAYGLFAARIHAPPKEEFTRKSAAYCIPKTNPFLRKLFSEIAGVDMPETIAWAVDDIVELLEHADMFSILKDFGKGKGKEDPVVHFYETFLAAYDPKMRQLLGVFTTPEPAVGYIVRSIDFLLRTRFNRSKGLADENTLVLDPATGTATFLYFVMSLIYQRFAEQKGAWDGYVEKHLLNRIFGFELLMAPYAIAHLKLGLLLQETGYTFGSDQRLGVYLTNTLEAAARKSEHLIANWISEEANAAAAIKRDDPILVVLGNPPYSNFGQMNRGEWILRLLRDYKKGLNETKLNLDDDFIKFIRFAQWRIERTGEGIIGFITNNTYLDGLTHRRMRECLLSAFNEIYVLNLHGSSKKQEVAPDGSKDENVFDITVGVSIAFFVKLPDAAPSGAKGCRVFHAELWGSRRDKYEALLKADAASTPWTELKPTAPHFYLAPREFKHRKEYERYWSLGNIFTVWQNGLKTDRDDLFFDFDAGQLKTRMEQFFSGEADEPFKARYHIEASSSFDIEARRARTEFHAANIKRCLYRPFDVRWLYYDPELTSRPAEKVMRHMLAGPNLAFITTRQTAENFGLGCTNCLAGHKSLAAYDINSVFPLYLYGDGQGEKSGKSGGGTMLMSLFEPSAAYGGRRANLNPKFIEDVTQRLGLKWVPVDGGDLKKTAGPEDIFHYAYAVFHSPTYRTRYAEFLKVDFPRLPLTSNVELFRALAGKGAELIALHLMESPRLNEFITEFPVKGNCEVEKAQYTDADQRVWINSTQYFGGVPKAVWDFHVGGYQVCEKWLKDRKTRKLTYDDLQHYQKVAIALQETIRLMAEIDSVIEKCGSWPIK